MSARHPDFPNAFRRRRKLPLPTLLGALLSMRGQSQQVMLDSFSASVFGCADLRRIATDRAFAAAAEPLIEQALQHGDCDLPVRAVQAISREMLISETNPYTCRKADRNPLERELVIPFGAAGFVALFDILSDHEVAVAAIRHQREDD